MVFSSQGVGRPRCCRLTICSCILGSAGHLLVLSTHSVVLQNICSHCALCPHVNRSVSDQSPLTEVVPPQVKSMVDVTKRFFVVICHVFVVKEIPGGLFFSALQIFYLFFRVSRVCPVSYFFLILARRMCSPVHRSLCEYAAAATVAARATNWVPRYSERSWKNFKRPSTKIHRAL